MPPIVTSATYLYDDPEDLYGVKYSRFGSPTREVLEQCLAALDDAKYGLAFATGIASLTAVITTLASGDRIVTTKCLYGGSLKVFDNLVTKMGIEVVYIDFNNTADLETALTSNTKIVWLETPTNPILTILDIRSIADVVHAKSEALMVVDNTFLTSYFQRPLELGADAVMYSLTKFTNGHSDVVMGAITTSNEKFYQSLKFFQITAGLVPAAFDCYIVNRSLKTLPLRMEQHSKNSYRVAKFLQDHAKVENVMHPALETHNMHEIAKSQSYGHSGIMGFLIKGKLEQSRMFLKAIKLVRITQSLGGDSTTISFPWEMTYGFLPENVRAESGATDNLIRISVGLEDASEIIKDLEQALNAIN